MLHEDYKEMLPAQALQAFDGSDLQGLDQHLADCEECRHELVDWQDTAGLLAATVTPAEPSPELRDRILRAVRNDPRTASADTINKVVPIRPRPATTVWPTLLRLAAGIGLLAMAAGLFLLWRHDTAMQQEVARLSREANAQGQELDRTKSLSAREREALALLTAPDTKRAQLSGSQEAKSARATFAFDQQTGKAVLLTEGLPPAPAEKAYELWFIANGRPIRGKVFVVDREGRATIADQVPPEARAKAVFAITLEPKGGVDAPTGPIYLSSPAS